MARLAVVYLESSDIIAVLLDKLAEGGDSLPRLLPGLAIHAGNKHFVHAHLVDDQLFALLGLYQGFAQVGIVERGYGLFDEALGSSLHRGLIRLNVSQF